MLRTIAFAAAVAASSLTPLGPMSNGPSGSLGRPGTRFRRVAKRELILLAATLRVTANWSGES